MKQGCWRPRGPPRRAIPRKLQTSLQAHYRDKDSSHIRPLFADEDDLPSIAVDQLSHTLAVITCDDKGRETQRTPITLDTLFSAAPTNAQRSVQRVLLLGDPGMGKTTLSQQLAYQWSQGTLWQEEFTYVYVLPVRTLSETLELHGLHKIWRDIPLTLPNAIIQRYYKGLLTDDTSYKTLHAQVAGHLASEDTLVVLDGLDERSEHNAAQTELIKAVQSGHHKLLLLSRPYNVAAARRECDLEVTHVGLSEVQMFDYIGTLSPLDHAARESLKEDLLTPPSHSAIKELACVPINL